MPGKVLLADDSLNIQRAITKALKAAGIEVVAFSNGEHAVRKLADVKPDLVLADVFMPVRTGYEVCAYVKNSPDFAHVPVLLMASSLEPYDEKEAQRVGADGRLTKPFTDTAALVNTVTQWLEKSAAAKPAPPREAFAKALPTAAPGPEPEPVYEEFSTKPSPVKFEPQAAPMGFADVLEEAHAPPKPSPAETETIISGRSFVRSEPVEIPPEPPVEEVPPAGVMPEPEPEPEPEPPPPPPPSVAEPPPVMEAMPVSEEAPPPTVELPPAPSPPVEEPPAKSAYQVETPELASPWEMTGPPPGAPEIPPGPEWDSQWKGVSPEEALPPTLPPPEEAAPPSADRVEPSELASALAAAEQATAEAVEQARARGSIDPAVIESVVGEIMKRLSPQVVEQITKEIVRPLAEALLKQKLDQQ